jgi:hypothetical protein
MDRVAFHLEDADVRLGCLLNPESLVIKRRAGIRPRFSSGNIVVGASMSDDSLIYAGGGSTWLDLDLLFDVTLGGSSITTQDVRDLTRPRWDLSENRRDQLPAGRVSRCLFFWGAHCIIAGVVTAVAERLEYFTAEGVPRRSWLRLRLVRVDAPPVPEEDLLPPAPDALDLLEQGEAELQGDILVHQVLGGGVAEGEDDGGGSGERLDQLAYQYLGDPGRWRELAIFNDIEDPLNLDAGMALEIPTVLGPSAVP